MRPGKLIKKGVHNPGRVPGFLLRKLFPNASVGSGVREVDGNVTFELGGFASADSRPSLLARHNYEVAYVREYLGERAFERSLEIGCGYGRLSPVFARFAESHFAVDINEEAVGIAERHHPEIEFDVQNSTDLTFQSDTFELVTTWTVLQHVPPEQIETAVDEIERVLKADGTLLICEATRYPERDGGHTWDRTVETYERLFAPLELQRHGDISEIDRLPEMETPGTVMLFEAEGRS